MNHKNISEIKHNSYDVLRLGGDKGVSLFLNFALI